MFKDLLTQLAVPFHSGLVEWKPQAISADKQRALAAAYVDMREYEDRLDQVYPEWESSAQFLLTGDKVAAVVSLTLDGVTRVNVGEAKLSDENAFTSAFAQAFKRVCSDFGLGRYLYRLPQEWCTYDEKRRTIINPPELPVWALPSTERLEKATARAVEREARLEGHGEMSAEPEPAGEPANGVTLSNPGEFVMPAGKYQGKTLAEIAKTKDGQDYLHWFANLDGKGYQGKGAGEAQRMARAFLALQASYAG